MESTPRTARRLVDLGQSVLDSGNLEAFGDALRRDWSPARLTSLLTSGSSEVVRCAAVGLGIIGGMSCTPVLAKLLSHDSPAICWAAEHALWRIWFRAGGASAQMTLHDIMSRLKGATQADLLGELDSLIRLYPVFAEAYNQRALAHYLGGDYAAAQADYVRAIHLN